MDNVVYKSLFAKGMIPSYSKLADLSSLQHKLIGSNVANVNTPDYEKREFEFDKELKKALSKPKLEATVTDPRHIPLGNTPGGPPKMHTVKLTTNSNGVNSVDIDQEMADLSQNQMIFEYGADMLARNFKGLKSAIRGEGR